MVDIAIGTHDLTRYFGPTRAVDGISFDVPRGILFGFLGPNGSGKTTTIRLLLGLLEPTTGRAEVLGFDTRTQSEEVRARCGALLEHDGLYEQMSAEDNLEFYGRIYRMPPAERRARERELLTDMGLWERRDQKVGAWSRGMKRKLAVARALLHHPPLVFLDEPTAGLDPVASASLHDDLEGLAEREGATVFLTTHNLSEAERLCARVAVISQGKLLAVGHPDELRARAGKPQVEFVGKGFDQRMTSLLRARPEVADVRGENGRLLVDLKCDTSTAPLISLLVGAGAQLEEVRQGKASLEEAFLALVGGEGDHGEDGHAG